MTLKRPTTAVKPQTMCTVQAKQPVKPQQRKMSASNHKMTPTQIKAKEIERRTKELNDEYRRILEKKPTNDFYKAMFKTPKAKPKYEPVKDYEAIKAEINEFISRYAK